LYGKYFEGICHIRIFKNILMEKLMIIFVGILLNLFFIVLFSAFGRFLKDCDDSMLKRKR